MSVPVDPPRLSLLLVPHETRCEFQSQRTLLLNLRFGPDAELQNPLEFFRRVVPPVVVAKAVSREMVLDTRATSPRVRKHVVSSPAFITSDAPAADMTPPTRALEHLSAVGL